jgi:DNA invertase Pin-like site-specific DNA recombinase
MIVLYTRVSTIEQNPDRQLTNSKEYDYVLTDYCSGSIPLYERPKGSEVKKMIDSGTLKKLVIHDVTRIGRNTLDVLTIWSDLTQRGIVIECKNPTLRNINEDGTVDKFSELMLSILSTMSQFEKSLIRERQLEGIKIRKEKGLYGGRRIGTTDTTERFLKKKRSQDILNYLNKGTYSYSEISLILSTSTTTVTKVKKLSQMVKESTGKV